MSTPSNGANSAIPGASGLEAINQSFAAIEMNGVAAPDMGDVPISGMVRDITPQATTLYDMDGDPISVNVPMLEMDDGLDDDSGELSESRPLQVNMEFPIEHKGKQFRLSRKTAGLPAQLASAAEFARSFPDRIATEIRDDFWNKVLAGDGDTYGKAYDGQNFFSAAHVGADADGNATTYSNYVTGAAGATQLDETNLRAAMKLMALYRSQKGVLFNKRQDVPAQFTTENRDLARPVVARYHLFVGYGNAKAAQDLVDITRTTPGPLHGQVSYEVVADIPDDEWILHYVDDSGMSKPMNFWRGETRLETEEKLGLDKVVWYARAAKGLGYRNWNTMLMSKTTA